MRFSSQSLREALASAGTRCRRSRRNGREDAAGRIHTGAGGRDPFLGRLGSRLAGAFLCAGLATGCTSGFPAAVDAGGGDDDDGGGPTGTGPTVLPFAVDDWYGPSGYMGDGENPGAIVDEQTCIDDRPTTWLGNCHLYTWTPSGVEWAGVYWQYPDGNWGDLPGLPIPDGATRISFQAWGAAGGETVDFTVGMMSIDGFQVTREEVVLGTEPTEYSLELAGAAYQKVVGGFGWVSKEAAAPVTFHIDDIRWE